ncbi:diaminopropionate ammonia-lyase [Fusobacterium mortiferum]|uniref:Diaminopropionate ammonia-lyase n=1 Tax=Fusobacterium mortiferum TaxID=850 RepID=A0A414PTW2_FUSMR|nr:diaminopropionate ammonia-lyase [Fusobacterium mortiferum]MCF2628598.1 diaminopropionate ammonia-lyase [Fusobacterium mortiferum]MCF2700244.1 diaminopropionate ammonia-lyase [Fusobacterium mortiferum]MCI6382437.1 diaminopropionate ammonia-lyase [Fusobacterium mortiferum]MCI7188443.1 diaminopropionate ammonia-lyase [Fusobacterium mortiferum]MCI7666083.1 diaminopropionate ammonia-lyase [Fusobacterium mortiferum]
MELLKWVHNTKSRDVNYTKEKLVGFEEKEMKEVYDFHKSLPGYKATPLVELDDLAKYYGVQKLWLKDESKRFGLNAFKVLGGSYAIGKYLSQKLGRDMSELPFNVLISDEVKKQLGDVTFVTATDGNHGRGVAWVANKLRQKSVVYMPKGSAKMRFDAIAREGADVSITDLNYDDAVRLANKGAEEHGWIMVQDTAWDGYEEIPLWIMQGYSTIINEIVEQLEAAKEEKPTHVFLQAGVGSFAGAVQGYLAHLYGDDRPITIICEPHGANCIYKSMEANDGKPHNVTGDLTTIMAGLACGEPNTISWKILRDNADFSVSCDDSIAARGMRVLSSPLGNDQRVISGESGAVGLGLFTVLSEKKEEYAELMKALKIDENSRILCISTEGDTDVEGYKNVVWNGSHPNK